MDAALLRKEIKFRGSRRAIKELDMVMGTFMDMYLDTLADTELENFRDVLLELDVPLLTWITGEKTPPEHIQNNPVWAKVLAHVKAGDLRK
jgi:antitoxin CptB